LHDRIRRHRARDPHHGRRRWRPREARERDRIEARDLREVRKVDAGEHVAVGDAVRDPHVLMLAMIVLGGFGEAYRREARREHRHLIAAAVEPVRPVNHPDVEVPQHPRREPGDVAGEIARGAVHLAAVVADLAEAARERGRREELAAVQTLLFAGQHGVDDRRGKAVARQHAGGFEHRGDTRAVVVRARRRQCGERHEARDRDQEEPSDERRGRHRSRLLEFV